MKNLTITELLIKFGEEDKAREFLERLRWHGEPTCPRCGTIQNHKFTAREGTKTHARKGVYFCSDCRQQFTVTVGTIMEATHIPLGKWIAAFFLICASKKSVSSLQMKRMLGITYKSAWFMTHRIRHVMDENGTMDKLTGTVEVDETYVGGKPRKGDKRVYKRTTHKTPVMALVARDGKVKTQVTRNTTALTVKGAIRAHVDSKSRIITDQYVSYSGIGSEFAGGHHTVNHTKGEYSRGDIYTNTVESFFALLKRGIYGTYHHVSREHLHRYASEFGFRWNTRDVSDGERMEVALGRIGGKRLMYRDS